MWVVMRLKRWDEMQVQPLFGGPTGPARFDAGWPEGWLAVFDDREAAETWAEGYPVVEMREREPSP